MNEGGQSERLLTHFGFGAESQAKDAINEILHDATKTSMLTTGLFAALLRCTPRSPASPDGRPPSDGAPPPHGAGGYHNHDDIRMVRFRHHNHQLVVGRP